MAIDSKEFELEKRTLSEKEILISNELGKQEEKNNRVLKKIHTLKKESHGSYNAELETTNKLLEITSEALSNIKECVKSPYFGRIDFREYKELKGEFYIGKFGMIDSDSGDEIIIDWRAPLANIYYSGTVGEVSYEAPGGWIDGELFLKRKYIIKDSKLLDAFDEGEELIIRNSNGDESLVDEFLKINLEQNSSNKLKEVVATIQKEQNEVIRAPLNSPLIIQGSAGSGKTTIALHRLAYLLYKFRDTLDSSEILVVAPHKMFLDYISNMLPSLGVNDVKQLTIEDIASNIIKSKKRYITKEEKLLRFLNSDKIVGNLILKSAKFKGSLFFKAVLDRYIKLLEVSEFEEIKDIKFEDFVLIKAAEIKRLYGIDMNRLSLNKRKQEIKKYLLKKKNIVCSNIFGKMDMYYDIKIKKIKTNMEDSEDRRKQLIELYDERDEKKTRLSKEYKKIIEDHIKVYNVKNIYDLYRDIFINEDIWRRLTENKVPGEIYDFIRSELEDEKPKVYDGADLIAMAYLLIMINGLDSSDKFRHTVIDEAQDYSMLEYSVLKLLTSNNSFTIVGDLAQGIFFFKGINDWKELNKFIFNNESATIYLKQSYRSTVEIIDYANEIFKRQNLDFTPSRAVLRHGPGITKTVVKGYNGLTNKLDEMVAKARKRGLDTIAVICKDENTCIDIYKTLKKASTLEWVVVKKNLDEFKAKLLIIPSYMTKGLEFDCSILINENSYGDNTLDNKLLYVSLTRSLHEQHIINIDG